MPLKCTRLIKQKTGQSLKDFCEQHLNSEYKTFQMRLRKRKLYPAEVAYICWFLGVSCEEAFGGASYEELVIFQGKGQVPDRAKALWLQADGTERIRLMSLLGMDLSFLTPEPPKQLPRPESATKAKRQPVRHAQTVKKDIIKDDKLSFFEDITPVQKPVEEPQPDGAPENDSAVNDFFIETYN